MGWKEERNEQIKRILRNPRFRKNVRLRVFYRHPISGKFQYNPCYYYDYPKISDNGYVLTMGFNRDRIPFVHYVFNKEPVDGTWMKICRCRQCLVGMPCTWAKVSAMVHKRYLA